MTVEEKLRLLGEAARYDASCASSGSPRPGASRGGICHVWTADGRCVSLLKVLQSSFCVHDCAYCAIRRSADIPRAVFTPEELAGLTAAFYRRNYIEGLFLSSGVLRSADHTMELMLRTVRLLRTVHGFRGYIHMKVIPGAGEELVREAGLWADRLSANIELPTEESLKALAPEKSYAAILTPMRSLAEAIRANREERRRFARAPLFAPAGQSTQMVVAATRDSDLTILRTASWLYRETGLRRVYYSAYIPVSDDPRLPPPAGPALLREHRLYQADWLIRLYGFRVDELLDPDHPMLDPGVDPKTAWALRHPERFPVEVNTADRETLLRVPGLGVRSVERILAARRHGRLDEEALRRLGVQLKRSRHFLTADGKPLSRAKPSRLRRLLAKPDDDQLLLFPDAADRTAATTGEL